MNYSKGSLSQNVTFDQWQIICPLLPEPKRWKKAGRGRPAKSNKEIFEAILYVLESGCRWKDLDTARFPPSSTVYDRFRWWLDNGFLEKALRVLGKRLIRDGLIYVEEASIDGSFIRGRNGGDKIGNTKLGKGTKLMSIVDGNGLPLGVHIESAQIHEVKLVERTLDRLILNVKPNFLLSDKAYDSEELANDLNSEYDINLIRPHKANRKRKSDQDGRNFRRYKRRYKVERTFSWIQNHRRCLVRYDKLSHVYLGWVQMAVLMIYAKCLL